MTGRKEVDPLLRAVDAGTAEPVISVASSNPEALAGLLRLYARAGMTIVDPTWGKGVFWAAIDTSDYDLRTSDLATDGIDFRQMPYADGVAHMVVLDPPYRYKPVAGTVKASVDTCYRLSSSPDITSARAVIDLYEGGMQEAHRILKSYGFLIVKCQDTIEAGKQVWTHCELMARGQTMGFVVKDLMVVVNPTPSPTRWSRHHHTRKGHSYFLVLRRDGLRTPGAKSTQIRNVPSEWDADLEREGAT